MNKNLSFLSITGPDAKKFLQGQVTCDVNTISDQQNSLGAHCNREGRVISFFRLFNFNNDYHLLMPTEMIEITINTLKKYAVFFKVNMSQNTERSNENFSLLNDIQNGIPQIYPETSGKFLPHELNLQYINAISFTKGCYTGQEIIARMHYRGQLKKHMYRGKISSNQIPLPFAEVYCEGNFVGNVVCAAQASDYCVLLFVANANDILNKTLYLKDNEAITILSLPYSF